MAKKKHQGLVRCVNEDGTKVRHLVPRLANNLQFMNEHGWRKEELKDDAAPIRNSSSESKKTASAKDLIAKVSQMTSKEALRSLLKEENDRKKIRSTVVKAIEERLTNLK